MRKSRFIESQIVTTPKEADGGLPVKGLIASLGSACRPATSGSRAMGHGDVAELARIRELGQENSRLKRIYAVLALENAADQRSDRKKAVESLRRRKEMKALIVDHGMSVRRRAT